jgi:hypothetical protein
MVGLLYGTLVVAFSSAVKDTTSASLQQYENNLLLLDHWNINHEKGRQDLLLAFWVDFLKCALDPRKLENVQDPQHRSALQLPPLASDTKKRTLWVNIGAHQFHLPQGKPDAQVLDGSVTLVYPSLQTLMDRYDHVAPLLQGSKFQIQHCGTEGRLEVTDPWGSLFYIIVQEGSDHRGDPRGRQPGEASEGLALSDLTIHTPSSTNLPGIGRFYQQILGAKVDVFMECVTVQVGPFQTLTFRPCAATTVDRHVDLRWEEDCAPPPPGSPPDTPSYPSNYGPHVSMYYVADLASTFQRAKELDVIYVNPRFSRRAYTKDEARKDCMFRCLDIIDPDNIAAGPILQLEHEIRSVVKIDGSKYPSCPFDDIPSECR